MLLDVGGDGEAVYPWHLCVKQYQWKRLPGLVGLLKGAQGGGTACNNRRMHVPAAEEGFQKAPIGGIVVHNEHWQTTPGSVCWYSICANAEPRGYGKVCGERKAAAFPLRTLKPEVPPHEMHQLFGNGQPETGTAILPASSAIGLRKRFEDQRVLIRRDTDPSVADRNVYHDLRGGLYLQGDLHNYLTLFGELDGVTHQIHEDLSQASRVAH
jgi:hypothetical protein